MLRVTLEEYTRHGLPVYPVEPFLAFGVDAFLTGRRGGVSLAPYDELNLGRHVGDDVAHVEENRRRVARAANVTASHLVFTQQVHGSAVNVINAPGSFVGDALVTRSRDLALVVLGADCIPLLVADSFSEQLAVIHAGWRGLAAGVIANTVSHFKDATTLHVFVGPSVSPATYQVGAEVADQFSHVADAVVSDNSPDDQPRYRLDLAAVARAQLRALGVPDAQTYQSDTPTDGGAQFYSDRAHRPTGRFALVARRASYDEQVEGPL
jgi:YfiH family protein